MKSAFLVLSVLIAACAVQGPQFERVNAPLGYATIYVYRPYSYGSSLVVPAVTCGDDTARIGPGGYHAFIVPADQPVVCHVAAETTDEVEFAAAQPRVYYIREELGWGLLSSHPHLDPIDNDKAQTEIAQCCVRQDSIGSNPPPNS
ncbi:MAG TPA: hypothetical protein VHY56_07730 [Candidatus Binataceae bacterium]|nr:hypothetical protein [Candidatus Binataceae bacterium]